MWANFQFSEARMVILGLLSSNIVLLECISDIIDFDVLCTLWVYKTNAPLMEKLGKNCWKSNVLSKDACYRPVSLLKIQLFRRCFHTFC